MKQRDSQVNSRNNFDQNVSALNNVSLSNVKAAKEINKNNHIYHFTLNNCDLPVQASRVLFYPCIISHKPFREQQRLRKKQKKQNEGRDGWRIR